MMTIKIKRILKPFDILEHGNILFFYSNANLSEIINLLLAFLVPDISR